jgi:hypothetical protein
MVDAPEVAFLIFAAEAIGFRRLRDGRCRDDKRSGFGEVRDAVLCRLMSCIVRWGSVCGKSEQRDGQNEAESPWSFERSVHFDLLSS